MRSACGDELEGVAVGGSHDSEVSRVDRGQSGDVEPLRDRDDGGVDGIQVKASFDLHAGDSKGLRALRDRLGPTFVTGIVLHRGDRVQRLDDRSLVMPISALWNPQARTR